MWTDSGGTRHKTIHTSTEQDIVAYNLQLLIQQNTIVEPCVGAVGRGGGKREECWDIGREEANCNFSLPAPQSRLPPNHHDELDCAVSRPISVYPLASYFSILPSLPPPPPPPPPFISIPHLCLTFLPLLSLFQPFPLARFFFVRHSFRPPAHRATVATYSA